MDQDKIIDKPTSAPYCAQSATAADLRYAALEVAPKGAHVSVIAYQLTQSYCQVLDGRTVAIVGLAFASPVASNAGEEGKARNRRVELVPLN